MCILGALRAGAVAGLLLRLKDPPLYIQFKRFPISNVKCEWDGNGGESRHFQLPFNMRAAAAAVAATAVRDYRMHVPQIWKWFNIFSHRITLKYGPR